MASLRSPPEFSLPQRCLETHPADYIRAQDAIDASGLPWPKRNLLLLALREFRCLEYLRRVPDLSRANLLLLASLLQEGSLVARSWGGGSARATPADVEEKGDGGSAVEASVGWSARSYMSSAGDPEPLLVALGITHDVLDLVACYRRQRGVADDADEGADDASEEEEEQLSAPGMTERCRGRQNDACYFTLAPAEMCHCSHIVPRAAADNVHADKRFFFWLMVLVVLGVEVRDWLWATVGEKRNFSAQNGILLLAGFHEAYGAGIIMIVPVQPAGGGGDGANDGTYYSDYYDVSLRLVSSTGMIDTVVTKLPHDPGLQVWWDSDEGYYVQRREATSRDITSGDCFRLFTHDPDLHPLPDPKLLEVHNVLWSLISACNLSEPRRVARTRKRRLTKSKQASGGGGDGGDSQLAGRGGSGSARGGQGRRGGGRGNRRGGRGRPGNGRGNTASDPDHEATGRKVGTAVSVRGSTAAISASLITPPRRKRPCPPDGDSDLCQRGARHGHGTHHCSPAPPRPPPPIPWYLRPYIERRNRFYASGHMEPRDRADDHETRSHMSCALLPPESDRKRSILNWIREGHWGSGGEVRGERA